MFSRYEYNKARYIRLKAEYTELLGGKCVHCGATEQLEFDHINSDTKSFNISRNIFYARKTVLEELTKCQLLCKSCHTEKTIIDCGHTPDLPRRERYRRRKPL